MLGTVRQTEFPVLRRPQPGDRRIQALFLNEIADHSFQNSQHLGNGVFRLELIVGVLQTALTAQGTAKISVEGYNPTADTLSADTNNAPQVRDILDWEAAAGKRVIAAQWSAGGILIPLAIQC